MSFPGKAQGYNMYVYLSVKDLDLKSSPNYVTFGFHLTSQLQLLSLFNENEELF